MFQVTTGVKTLFYVNLITFLSLLILSLTMFDMRPYLAAWPFESGNFSIYQLLTYQFTHGGPIHLLMNMMGLVFLAPTVESYLGTKKFYIFYLICGIFAALLHLTMSNSMSPLVGASGSIWGIVMMFTVMLPNEKLNIMFIPIGIKAKYLISVFLLIEIISIVYANDNISHWGHLGGAISGVILYYIDKYIIKNRNRV